VSLWLLGGVALASRPTDLSGLYAFESEDTVESLDGEAGLVRVHYSVEGPNQVLQGDEDGDGLPDFAQDVARSAEAVLAVFEAAGLRLPLNESDMGLQALGGSDALDFYLVDFAGTGDGQLGVDTCQGGVCSGYMVMENDFTGYGYRDLDAAILTLTSHELFHGVQYAYLDDLPGWMSEGTAMWAEYLYDPQSEDFIAWCGRYLSEPDRGLDLTPAGAFTGWEYGTGLFFGFLDAFLGPQTIVDLMEELSLVGGEQALSALETAILAQGSDLVEVWTTFASWNLATGRRAGGFQGYPFAEELEELEATAEADSIVDDERVYPLASVYLYLSHPGGPLFLGSPDELGGLAVQVMPSSGGVFEPVLEPLLTVFPDQAGVYELGEHEAGGLWVIFSQPAIADSSISFDYCLGGDEVIESCGLSLDEGEPTGPDEPEGCGCAAVEPPGLAALLPALFAFIGLRRARRPA